jgi:hypothetical protein
MVTLAHAKVVGVVQANVQGGRRVGRPLIDSAFLPFAAAQHDLDETGG